MATKANRSPRSRRGKTGKAVKPQAARAPAKAARTTKTTKAAKTAPKARAKVAAAHISTGAGIAPAEYVSNPFNLIKPSLRTLRVNWLTALITFFIAAFAIAATVIGVISTIIILLYAHNARVVAIASLVTLLLAAFGIIIAAPLATIVLLESAQGKKLTLRAALRRCWYYSGRIFVAGLLTTLATLGGLVLFIVPGVVFLTWFSLSAYVIVDEDVGGVEAMRRSRRLVRGHLVEMWGLYGLNNFLSLIPFIGSLISLGFTLTTLAAPALRYLQLKDLQAVTAEPVGDMVDESRPPVHWANWIIAILAAITLVMSGYQGVTSANRASSDGSSQSTSGQLPSSDGATGF